MATKKSCPKSDVPCGLPAGEEPTRRSEEKGQTSLAAARGDGHALALPVHKALSAASLLAAGGAELVAPNVLSLLHWERIEQGGLYALDDFKIRTNPCIAENWRAVATPRSRSVTAKWMKAQG